MATTTQLAAMDRKERADRTYQRIVYRKLVDFQTAIIDAKRHDVPIGVCGELDTRNLIEDICKIGDIEYRSIEEKADYEPPKMASVSEVTDVPIIALDDEGVDV